MGNKFMKTGISLYFSNGVEKNEAMIRKSAESRHQIRVYLHAYPGGDGDRL